MNAIDLTTQLATTGLPLERVAAKPAAEWVGARGYLYKTDKSREGQLVTLTGTYRSLGRVYVTYRTLNGDSGVYAAYAKFAKYLDQDAAREFFALRSATVSAASSAKEYDLAKRLLLK